MLEKLFPIAGSSYDESSEFGTGSAFQGSGECMPGTRVGVLAELMAWATDPHSPSIYVLTGMAGAGKTAIARSFARALDNQRLLGASFFCSRASEARSNVGAIIPSLAFHLAWHSELFARALIPIIQVNPGVTFNLRTVDFQFTTLMLQPLRLLAPGIQAPILVIDALDECSSIDAVQALLKVLIHSNEAPLKIFITSRPEPHINMAFQSEVLARRLRLHDVEREIVTADIARYLRTNLHNIASKLNATGWPSDDDLQELVTRTGDLFIFAFTAIQYLSAKFRSHLEVQRRFQNILCSTSPTKILTAGIDTLYGQIVDNAWNDTEPDEKATRQRALATVLCLREPLSVTGISGLLAEDPAHLKASLADFHSVIDIPPSEDAPLLIFHSSFPDYLTDHHRAGSNALDISAYHAALAFQCINCLNARLRENLCNINRRDSKSTITESAIGELLQVHLQYAATYWGTHLSLAPPGTSHPTLVSELNTFATTHILHWLECLSIIGKLQLAHLKTVQPVLTSLPLQECPELRTLLDEVRQVVPQIFRFASVYPLEIYYSALEWLPRKSRIYNIYSTNRHHCVRLGLPQRWAPCEQILQQGVSCLSVAFSPDGTRIACGLINGRIGMWRVEIGENESELVGHSGAVWSVTFSPDGIRLASGSADNTVRIWNFKTRRTEQQFTGHSENVWSVVFSPDSTRIASGSADKTIRIWNIQSGQMERKFSGHSDWVRSVAFSKDGARIASGSHDSSVRLWNTETGKMERKFIKHTHWVRSVAFCPNGVSIASGGDNGTVLLWNFETGEIKHELAGHSDPVNSVLFSPDGAHLASGSDDRTIRVWNIETGDVDQILAGHTNWVRSIAFSTDGTSVASASFDWTVRIWNAGGKKSSEISREEKAKDISGTSGPVSFVTFSPDGARLALGSSKIVQIWNVETQEVEQELVGHSDRVRSIAFSGNGARIASASKDKTIRVWNVETGMTEKI
ncbi:WD40-repeat-containing domain protein, partial [Mycena capillaripes]